MNWNEICRENDIDDSFLRLFAPRNGITLLNKEQFRLSQERISQVKMGFELLPLLTDTEDSYLLIYTTGFLKGKVVIIDLEATAFIPSFKSIQSFLEVYFRNTDATTLAYIDWNCDYDVDMPSDEPEVLRECWKYIKADNFVSEAQKVMICCMAIYLTPLEQRDSLFYFLQSPFIDDESETTETIVWEAINSFTGDNPYPSAKPMIAALFEAEKFNDYPYKDIIFDGEFKEKGFKVFWRENQFWLVILLLSLLLFISRFFW